MQGIHQCVETPGPLGEIPGLRACFITRIPGIETVCDKATALERLHPAHLKILSGEEPGCHSLVTAEQIHGNEVLWVDGPAALPIPRIDGLATARRGLTLGIHVADCAPVWLVARNGSAGALLHAGRKGTELGIVTRGIRLLLTVGRLRATDLLVVIGPCIRPPCYEVDFAREIARQALAEGIEEVHDEGICTACHPGRYYSYRRESGLTGRMLATLTLLPN